ncbi:hypothetical protein [Silvimonas iriomotensis]|uniref:Uncharacterized protein n=1 Tax=Silvimonas iriomotensis TaxID=449662 RepID=A0ABQ2P6R8_9NEIS|nr:hypothetical protein [Silvimonas iriomotensis]GGP19070.1 hypothetical protein GCM10010970_08790 [Silvimonas iriomotensis]
MTIDLRGSGPVASIMQSAAIRAKPGAPRAGFNLSRHTTPHAPEQGDEPDDTTMDVEAPTPTAAPVMQVMPELSTQVWLRRLQIEKRIAPQNEDGAQGRPAATPASVYDRRSLTPAPAGGGFIEKG